MQYPIHRSWNFLDCCDDTSVFTPCSSGRLSYRPQESFLNYFLQRELNAKVNIPGKFINHTTIAISVKVIIIWFFLSFCILFSPRTANSFACMMSNWSRNHGRFLRLLWASSWLNLWFAISWSHQLRLVCNSVLQNPPRLSSTDSSCLLQCWCQVTFRSFRVLFFASFLLVFFELFLFFVFLQ